MIIQDSFRVWMNLNDAILVLYITQKHDMLKKRRHISNFYQRINDIKQSVWIIQAGFMNSLRELHVFDMQCFIVWLGFGMCFAFYINIIFTLEFFRCNTSEP